MDYYLKKHNQALSDMVPHYYHEYLGMIENYMMQERHKNIFAHYEDRRRETVYKLVDIGQHCFKLVNEPIQVDIQGGESQKDEQLQRRIQKFNEVVKPVHKRQAKIRRSKKNGSQRKQGNNRKVRTTITQAKLDEMNRIFSQYLDNQEKNKNQNHEDDDYLGSEQCQRNQQNSLKKIGEKLGLGYSTILHKFREFRATKKVKGGALIAAMSQKRKYSKSKQIQQLISVSLQSNKFYTAVQLSNYIKQNFGRDLSRSIISRHLGQMGFSYKNIKTKQPTINSNVLKDMRKKYGLSLSFARDSKNGEIYYIDECWINLKQFNVIEKSNQQQQREQQVFIMILASKKGIQKYLTKNQPFNEEEFQFFLQQTRKILCEKNGEKYIVLDMQKIHCTEKIINLRELIRENNIRLYYLPPFSYQINMLQWLNQKIKQELNKHQYDRLNDLKSNLQNILQSLESPSQSEMIQVSIQESDEYLLRACNNHDFDK